MTQRISLDELAQRAANIKLLIMDVDGVLTDGKVTYSSSGEELKSFNIKDGLGIKLLSRVGIKTAIITGRQSPMVERRANELGINKVIQGHSDKRQAFQATLEEFSVTPDQVAHIGDDLPDLPLMQRAALGIAVADANKFVLQHADWVTQKGGGAGAVRDVSEWLLQSRNELLSLQQEYLK